MPGHARFQASRPERSGLEVADIFAAYGEAYRHTHGLTPDQLKAMTNIVSCRTAMLGGHLDVCESCAFKRPSYNSCRNRHCPKCQSLAQATWIEQRMTRLLPVRYFHVVFTLPSELRALTAYNRERMYDLLFLASAATLCALGNDEKRLGAQLGVTSVLHTWTRKLEYHPHVHCIVTGGGLTRGDEPTWVSVKGRFMFPVRVLSKLFRGKFLELLTKARSSGELVYGGACAELSEDVAFQTLKAMLYQKKWVVYAKQPFGGAKAVYSYLGRYTHRVGISNQRLVSMDERGVTFRTKGDNTITLAPVEFIRRFLNHVLPKGFVKIRHFGLHASGNVHAKLALAQRLLAVSPDAPTVATPVPSPHLSWEERLRALTGQDIRLCPRCETGRLERHPLPEQRAPP